MQANRKVIAVLLIAGLATVAVGMTAATIGDTYSPDVDTAGQEPGERGGGAGGGAGSVADNVAPATELGGSQGLNIPSVCIRLLTQTPVIVGIVLAFAAAVWLFYRAIGFTGAVVTAYLLGLPTLFGYALTTQCAERGTSPGAAGVIGDVMSKITAPDAVAGSPVSPVVVLGLIVVVGALAVGALLSSSGSEEIEPPQEEEGEETDLSEFAHAAGSAADRIESANADVDNAVYQAWWDMTALLDTPNPEASTPGEFADAAVDAGLEAGDVDQLTELFEEVRYGGMDPEPREELAIETLRSIEEKYGDAGDAEGDTDASG